MTDKTSADPAIDRYKCRECGHECTVEGMDSDYEFDKDNEERWSKWTCPKPDCRQMPATLEDGWEAIPKLRAPVADVGLPDVLPEYTNESGAQFVSMATVQTVLRAARAALASAAVVDDPIRALIAKHAELLEGNDYAYFELARTRRTDWMAWLCSHPSDTHPDRKVLACGQGSTPDEACRLALADFEKRAKGE